MVIGGTDFRVGKNEGGVAYVNAFASENLPNIAYVFPFDKFDGSMNTDIVLANTASHEAGHAFGLFHQSLWNGSERVKEYHPGDGNRVYIMGDHGEARAVWWEGTNSEGDSQDDMATLARAENGFGYRPDDHGNGLGGASSMNVGTATFKYYAPDGSGGSVRVTEKRGALIASGVIEKTDDLDYFRFDTGGGNVAIRLAQPRVAESGSNVGNLRATMRLFDSSGNRLEEDLDVVGGDYKVFDRNLAAGTYFVEVGSFGEYGDVGQYTLTVVEDTGARVVNSEFLSLSPNLAGLKVTFNEAINPLTFTAMDVRIGGGAAGVGVVEVKQLADPRQFLVTLLPTYMTPMKVAIGPDIADLFGNRMDQNQNGVKGELSDYYLASYMAGYLDGGLDGGLETNDDSTTKTTLATKNRLLSSRLVDAVFDEF